ncbi:uncharacterized protein GJ701_005691 isoform 2-T2 [Geothlypis trichas]
MYRCERTWPPPCPGDALPAAPGAGAKKEHRSQAAMGSSPASFLTPAPSSSACLQNLWAQKALAQVLAMKEAGVTSAASCSASVDFRPVAQAFVQVMEELH